MERRTQVLARTLHSSQISRYGRARFENSDLHRNCGEDDYVKWGPRDLHQILSAELTELVLHSTWRVRARRHCTLGRESRGTVFCVLYGHGGAGHARRSAQAPPLPPLATPTAWRPSSSVRRQSAPLTAASRSAPSGRPLNHRQQVHIHQRNQPSYQFRFA